MKNDTHTHIKCGTVVHIGRRGRTERPERLHNTTFTS